MAETNTDVNDVAADEAPVEQPKAPPIESRFLFVDVAAMRAKQLRRGARVRLDAEDEGMHRQIPHKAERIAMEEVRRGLVEYDVPTAAGKPAPAR